MSLTLTMLALGIWITLLDYPYLGRCFYLICTLIQLFGLLFIPPAHTFICMVGTFVVSFTALSAMGLMSSVQAVTLLAYCGVIAVVSAAKHRSLLRNGQSNERMRASARHDELTGMLNRMGLDEDANGFVGKQIAVLLSDIDEFKSYNDLYGHEVGDLMLKEYAHAGHTASFSVKARVLLLLAQLAEIDPYSFYGLDHHMMEIVAYLGEHCATASVASLAQRFGYSETYFSQLVRRRCGMRARELIVAARLRKARELLLSTDLAAHDVAAAVGYESYSHFNRIFKQVYRITPAAYRAFAAREVAR
jgi:AraC-like DNA-binding protein